MRYLKKLSEHLLKAICLLSLGLALSFYCVNPVWAAPSGIQKKANPPSTPYRKSVMVITDLGRFTAGAFTCMAMPDNVPAAAIHFNLFVPPSDKRVFSKDMKNHNIYVKVYKKNPIGLGNDHYDSNDPDKVFYFNRNSKSSLAGSSYISTSYSTVGSIVAVGVQSGDLVQLVGNASIISSSSAKVLPITGATSMGLPYALQDPVVKCGDSLLVKKQLKERQGQSNNARYESYLDRLTSKNIPGVLASAAALALLISPLGGVVITSLAGGVLALGIGSVLLQLLTLMSQHFSSMG